MKRTILSGILLTAGLWAQTAAVNPAAGAPASASFLSQIADPLTISLAAYDLSQVASGSTAWKFTLQGKVYTVNPAQRTGMAAAATIGAAAAAHRWPKLKPWLAGILGGASAYYGGVAYANSQAHGAASPATAGAAPAAASAKFRLGR